MAHKIHEHHAKGAEHHELAAKHHKEAAKHHEAGHHEKAAHHSHLAHRPPSARHEEWLEPNSLDVSAQLVASCFQKSDSFALAFDDWSAEPVRCFPAARKSSATIYRHRYASTRHRPGGRPTSGTRQTSSARSARTDADREYTAANTSGRQDAPD
jgi:hypothetical protein